MDPQDRERFRKLALRLEHEDAPFFRAQETLIVARAPGRLDVMGGIADYSGSLVLEMPIAEGTWAAVQAEPDPLIHVLSLSDQRRSHMVMPLADLGTADRPLSYGEAAAYFQRKPDDQWGAYVAGALHVLMREKGISFAGGVRFFIQSNVPEGKGVSSSAAIEVAAMLALTRLIDVALEATDLAHLCQLVENRIVGAPCGIMDQMTVVHGRAHQLLALRCQPAEIEGYLPIPDDLAFWGIDSGIRHNVGGADYSSVRVGAFMGFKILQHLSGHDWKGYLANVSPSVFEQQYRQQLPLTLRGADFLARYGPLPDSVTTIDPAREYAVRSPTAHPIHENFRARLFAHLLRQDNLDDGPLLGELMYQAHASYNACGLGSEGTDRLVDLIRSAGTSSGLFGAKITGGGSGGTVVVLGRAGNDTAVAQIAARYEAESGHRPHIFQGSSDGALAPL